MLAPAPIDNANENAIQAGRVGFGRNGALGAGLMEPTLFGVCISPAFVAGEKFDESRWPLMPLVIASKSARICSMARTSVRAGRLGIVMRDTQCSFPPRTANSATLM